MGAIFGTMFLNFAAFIIVPPIFFICVLVYFIYCCVKAPKTKREALIQDYFERRRENEWVRAGGFGVPMPKHWYPEGWEEMKEEEIRLANSFADDFGWE